MKEDYSEPLRKLEMKYSSKNYGEYKDGGLYSKLLNYHFNKDELSIVLNPDGKPEEHSELIKCVISDLIKILPKDYIYKLSICGYYSFIKNGNFDITFTDGNYYIEEKHQEMHNRKEAATIMDVANLNKIAYTEFKWNILKKKSIELGFAPVKDKSGHENLYLIEAFKICYPEYNYDFGIENKLNDEPKRKKFLGLF
jgi:hypothetical protein